MIYKEIHNDENDIKKAELNQMIISFLIVALIALSIFLINYFKNKSNENN